MIAAGVTVGAVQAAPAGTPYGNESAVADPMSRLLAERGLIPPSTGGAPGAAATAPTPTAPSITQQVRDRASELVVSAMNFLGVPYRRGGNDADSGFDCSGFTKHLFEMTFGLVLPRRVDDQASAAGLVKVPRQDLQPGDLVFFNTLRRTFSHVGIYVGDGRFIHAPRTGAEIRVEDMRGPYWNQRFTGARRLADPAATVALADSGATSPAARRAAPARAQVTSAPAGRGDGTATFAPNTGPQSDWQP